MKHEIKTVHDRGWGTFHELYLEGWRNPLATLTVGDKKLMRSPQPPSINWVATGRQDPATTKAFAEGLLELVAIAEALESKNA